MINWRDIRSTSELNTFLEDYWSLDVAGQATIRKQMVELLEVRPLLKIVPGATTGTPPTKKRKRRARRPRQVE